MGKYGICNSCHIAFDKKNKICPSCGKKIEDEKTLSPLEKEGDGRKHHAGGEACDYCPHCYGNADWCPVMGD